MTFVDHSDDLAILRRLIDSVEFEPERCEAEAQRFLDRPDPKLLALAQRCIGLAERTKGRFEHATRWFELAIATAHEANDEVSVAEAKTALAPCVAMAGDFEFALELLDDSLPQLEEHATVNALNYKGMVLQRTERYDEALKTFNEAETLARSVDAKFELAKLMMNRSILNVARGELDRAVEDSESAIANFQLSPTTLLEAKAMNNFAWVLTRQGKIAEALRVYGEADSRWGDSIAASSTGARDRAELYVTARLFREALRSAKHARTSAEDDGLSGQIPEIDFLIGRIHAALGRWDAAESAFERSAQGALAQQGHISATVAQWCRDAMAQDGREFGVLPISVFRDSYLADVVDVAYSRAGYLTDLNGSAVASLRSVIAAGNESPNRTTKIQAMLSALTVVTDPVELLARVDDVMKTLAEHFHFVQSDELRAVFTASMRLEETLSDAAIRCGQDELFVEFFSRLQAELNPLRTRNSIPSTRQIARRSAESSRKVPLIGLRTRGFEPETSAESVLVQRDREREVAELEIRSAHWTAERRSGPSADANATADDLVARSLESNDTLLFYAMSSDALLIQRFRNGERSLFRCGPSRNVQRGVDAVRIAVTALLREPSEHRGNGFHGSDLGRLQRALDYLDELVSPVDEIVGEVSIIGNGLLASVPWHLLSRFSASTVRLFPTVAEWLRRSSAETSVPPRVGLVCGPGLSHGEREIDEIAALYGDPQVLVGSDATVEGVLDLLGTVDLAHIVAHGSRRSDSAFLSGIELFDGQLMGYDLAELDQTPRRIVLSCCDLGAANTSGLSPSFGFVSTLRHHTAVAQHEVLAPVLPIDDRITTSVMVDVHQRIRAGADFSRAIAGIVHTESTLAERLTAGSFNVTGR